MIAYNTPSNVQYCMFKVADARGNLPTASIYAAFEQAYVYDIDVVTVSLSGQVPLGYEGYRKYDAILKKLYEKGVIVYCSAGNDANHKVDKDIGMEVEKMRKIGKVLQCVLYSLHQLQQTQHVCFGCTRMILKN